MSFQTETVYAKRLTATISAQGKAGVVLIPVKSTISIEAAITKANRWLSADLECAARSFSVRPGRLDIADQIRRNYDLDSERSDVVSIIHVCGFDLLSTDTLNDMCSMLNRDRDILALLPAILVFWLNDTAFAALARRAPFFVSGPFPTVDLWDGFDEEEAVKIGREKLIAILSRFPFCVKRESGNLSDEADLQRILWAILRSHYDDLSDEVYLPAVGKKQYRIDFLLRHLRVLIEVKFVRPTQSLSALQDALFADIVGYFPANAEFDVVLFFIYDSSSRQQEWPPLVSFLKARPEVLDVVVIPHVCLE